MSYPDAQMWRSGDLRDDNDRQTKLIAVPLVHARGVIILVNHRSSFECVMRKVLYKPYCDSNDWELPSRQATSSTLARGTNVACGEASCQLIISVQSIEQ